MDTDCVGVKQATVMALWSAESMFLEGLFWVLLHLILKVVGLVQVGVNQFNLVARGSHGVHEHGSDNLNCNAQENYEPGYDFVSPPIYGYWPASYARAEGSVHTMSMPPMEGAQDGLGASIQRPYAPHVKFEGKKLSYQVRDPVNEDLRWEVVQCVVPINKLEDLKLADRQYTCSSVKDQNSRSDIPHFARNFEGHTWKKWYAVAKGRKMGIFKCWEAAEDQVKRFSYQKHHSFKSHVQAEEWYRLQVLGFK